MVKNTSQDSNNFTPTQVGTLIEKLRSEFRVFSEGLSIVRDDVRIIKDELGRQKENIFIIKADIRAIKTMLGTHGNRLLRLEKAVLQ